MLLQKGICTYNPRVSHSANGKRRSYSFLNVNGCIVRVSHILVKLVIKRIFLLNVLQVGMKHLTDYFWISFEQKRIFGNEKVSALVAKTGNGDTASAGRQRSVFHDYALMAGRGKTIFDEIGKRTFEVENGCALFHHLGYHGTALGFFLFA